MIKIVEFDAFGIHFYVEIDYDQDGNKCSVGNVRNVCIENLDGKIRGLKCDTERFEKDFDGEIYEALEEALESDKQAYGDMLYESKRDESINWSK